MEKENSNQQLGLLGENLVSANLLARGWDVANLNASFGNFKNIDLICQNKDNECVNIQVKTLHNNNCAFIGLTSKEAVESISNNLIVSAWVVVHIKSLDPLRANYYVLSKGQMIKLVSKLHQWYLYEWNRPAKASLENSPAGVHLWMLECKNRSSKFSDKDFINPLKDVTLLNNWDNIWLP